MTVRRPSPNSRAAGSRRALAAALLAAGCTLAEREQTAKDAGVPDVSVQSRVTITHLGSTPVSDSATISAVVPEADGEAIAVIVSDPLNAVRGALVLVDGRRGGTPLVWPDSVRTVWWSGAHELAFTTATGSGARVVVDVHSAALEAIVRAAAIDTQAPPSSVVPPRARTLVDSLLNAPMAGGGTVLRFAPLAVVPSPDGRWIATWVASSGGGAAESNPRWLIADGDWRRAVIVDSVSGPAREMPRGAAGWTRDGRFVFAKGLTLHEAMLPRPPATR